jgi:hypothetical protein
MLGTPNWTVNMMDEDDHLKFYGVEQHIIQVPLCMCKQMNEGN